MAKGVGDPLEPHRVVVVQVQHLYEGQVQHVVLRGTKILGMSDPDPDPDLLVSIIGLCSINKPPPHPV